MGESRFRQISSRSKVILVCDRQYVDKSNKRSGGAGTEAQIITPELYAKKEQDKFVAVIRERDDSGKAYLPAYYGSRIYFDLCDSSVYAAEFEKLIRWAWDKPVYNKPELGRKPTFLEEESNHFRSATSIVFRRAIESIKNSRDNSIPLTVEYFDIFSTELERFRIYDFGPEFDTTIMKSIADFIPLRNELIEMFATISIYNCESVIIEKLHYLFEKLLPYMRNPIHMTSWNDTDFDNFYFVIHELFLYCQGILLSRQRFEAVSFLIDNQYFFDDPNSRESMHPYVEFNQHMRSLDHYNQRQQCRRLSVRADLLKERNGVTGVDFMLLMQADLILYLRSWDGNDWIKWYPETLIWAARRGATFEVFARSKSRKYFERVQRALGVKSKAELGQLLDKIESKPDRIPRWHYDSLNLRQLVQFESISSTP